MRLSTSVAVAGGLWLVLACALIGTAAPSQAAPSLAGHEQTQARISIDSLTLAEALRLTVEHNAGLANFAEEIRARDAAALQQGLLPNPELSVEVENFAGDDSLQNFDGAETTISLSQLIELGGKRDKRRRVANLEKALAEWEYQSQKLDLLTATSKAFIRVLAAQEQVVQSDELTSLAEQTLAAVTARVEAGKVAPLEQTRAQVELAVARTSAAKARRELEISRRGLVAFWGEQQAAFGQAVGDLTSLLPLPAEVNLRNLPTNNPDVARWKTVLQQRQVAVEQARSQSVPDLTISFGVRNLGETDSNALVAGIQLPLPFFDRNQGGIGEARARQIQARHQQQAAAVENLTQLSQAWQALASAHQEAGTLRDEILPGAQSAFVAAELGYREGKFDFLQMLDAQRTLFEAKGQYIESLAAYHQARADVERLTGAQPAHILK